MSPILGHHAPLKSEKKRKTSRLPQHKAAFVGFVFLDVQEKPSETDIPVGEQSGSDCAGEVPQAPEKYKLLACRAPG